MNRRTIKKTIRGLEAYLKHINNSTLHSKIESKVGRLKTKLKELNLFFRSLPKQ